MTPEILASLFFGPLSRLLFGEGNPNAPVYFVMLGGVCLLAASICVQFVDDVGATVRVTQPEATGQPALQRV